MPPATFLEILDGLTPAERATRKAEGLASIINTGSYTVGTKTLTLTRVAGYSYVMNGVTITVAGATVSGNKLSIVATASDANGPLPVPESYGYVNPPIMHRVDESTAYEDVLNVAKAMLYDSVVTYARSHGWQG